MNLAPCAIAVTVAESLQVKVVIDTNVWVSAAICKGPSHELIQQWLVGAEFELIMCPELLGELTEVLTTRERLRRWVSLEFANSYLEMISTLVDLVADPPREEHGIRDGDDSYLVTLARMHGCEYIITGDKDLLEWPVQVPPCITPADFLQKS
jgi:putative PIN family toxin of toxin-antitoxin system